MGHPIRRIVLAFVLFLGILAVLTFVLLLANKNRDQIAQSEDEQDTKASLIQEISNYGYSKNKTAKAQGPKSSGNSKQQQLEAPKHFVHSPLPDAYSVVSVVPELKTEKYDSDQSRQSISTSIEPEHRSWLTSPTAIDDLISQAGDSDQTYGWMQITRPIDLELIRETLNQFNTTILGSAGDLVRLRVPNDKESLYSIRDLSWVSGIGALPPNKKISQSFQEEVNGSIPSEQLPVFVSVMDSKSEDEFRRALVDLGVSVGHFDPSIRVFAAVVVPSQVHDVLSMDFVHFIEPIGIVAAMHDTAVPAQGVDKLRTIGDLSGTFSGFTGATTPIAVMDTGLNTNHVDISTFRESICAKNFVEGEDSDLFFDANGHGTHVTGTVVGNGFFVPKYAGMAPGVQHIRFAKVLNKNSRGTTFDVLEGMDFLGEESSCFFDGQETESLRPLIVNMSLSSSRLDYDSRSTQARKLDSIVWTHRQLYVVANSNSSIHGYSNYGASKNSLPVGLSYDMGHIHGMSSLGPTADNRLTPLVSGTGARIWSASGLGQF